MELDMDWVKVFLMGFLTFLIIEGMNRLFKWWIKK